MVNNKDKRVFPNPSNPSRRADGSIIPEIESQREHSNRNSSFSAFSDRIAATVLSRREEVFVVSPGLVLLLIGIGILLFPRLFLALVATFIVVVGALLCFIGWKFLQFKRKVMKMAKDFEAKVYVQGVQVGRGMDDVEQFSDKVTELDVKKFILH